MVVKLSKKINTEGKSQKSTLSCDFQNAVALHQSGQWDAARSGYAQLLAQDPSHSDALHLLGVLACQNAEHARAADLMTQAIAIAPQQADYHYNLGIALQALGRLHDAVASYDRAIALQARYANAHTNRGNALHALGQFDAALASHQQALALDPADAACHSNCGNALQGLGQFDAAVACYDLALSCDPGLVDAHVNRGNALKALHQPALALDSYARALALSPSHVDACFGQGSAFQATRQWDQALASYDDVLALAPGHAQAHFNRALVLHALKLVHAALAAYARAIACEPLHALAHSNRGVLLHEQKRLDDALASYDSAIAANPAFDGAYYNRANVRKELQQWDAALADYDTSIALNPLHAAAHLNRGNLYYHLGNTTAAVACYDQALAADPDYHEARFNKSIPLLLCGDFATGWAHYAWRWKNPALKMQAKHGAYALWQGQESLQGKTVLLHNEQGLGDTLQFCRYTACVAALGARVVLEVQAPLLVLLQSLHGVSHLMAEGVDPVAVGETIDFQCPLLGLPQAFQTDLHTIPASERYLHSNPAKVHVWHARLGAVQRPRVGLVWSGSVGHRHDLQRSIPLQQLLAYLPEGLDYVCLQKELRPADRDTLQACCAIRCFSEELHDLDDTAALVECMDLVLSVDTSVVHLAGALGKQGWLLLPLVPDWRWLLGRDTSPWYPSLTLYRQNVLDDWDSVLARVRGDLQAVAAAGVRPKRPAPSGA